MWTAKCMNSLTTEGKDNQATRSTMESRPLSSTKHSKTYDEYN